MPTGPDTTPATGDPIRPGYLRSLARSPGAARRRWVVLAVLATVAVVTVVSILVFTALSTQSQSYRDGYSVGGSIFSLDTEGEGAHQACTLAEHRAPGLGGLPAGDSVAQWLQGCLAAFDAAESGN